MRRRFFLTVWYRWRLGELAPIVMPWLPWFLIDQWIGAQPLTRKRRWRG